MEPAGGVGDDEGRPARHRRIERVVHDGAGIGAGGVCHDGNAGSVGPDPELIDRGGTERVRGSEDDRLPLFEIARGELADRRRLAGAIDTHDEDDRRAARSRGPRRPVQVPLDEERRELVADRGLGSIGVAATARPLDEVHGQRRAHVARDERLFDVVPGRAVDAAEIATELGHERAARPLQALIERVRGGDREEGGRVERRVGSFRLGLGGSWFRGGLGLLPG